MSNSRHTQWMVVTALLGLVVACYTSCPSPARADTILLPAGTAIRAPGQPEIITNAVRFAVTRPALDRANAAAATSARLTGQLTACTRSVVRATRPEPGWRIAARWFGIGAAVAGAFMLGTTI